MRSYVMLLRIFNRGKNFSFPQKAMHITLRAGKEEEEVGEEKGES